MSEHRQPRGLYRLFFTEMWERLAFYTMINVLLLYATDSERGGLGLTSAEGNEIYGLYLAFVYFTPFPGGMIADRFIGYRRAVLLGGLIMSAGLLIMSTPGTSFFVTGLVCLVLGTGLLKPNISVMVGNLYPKGDPRRDSGFNIFYMGINIGAFTASFLASAVRNHYGWLWTFRAAGIGLLIGMAILIASWKVLEAADRKPERSPDDAGFSTVFARILLPALVTGALGFAAARAWFPDLPVRPAVFGFMIGMVPVLMFFVGLGRNAKEHEKAGLKALLPIYLTGGTFFMILHLNGSAMTQWARDTTARDVWAPASLRQSALPSYYDNAGADVPRPAPASLAVVADASVARAFGQKRMDERAVAAVLGENPDLRPVEIDAHADPTALDGEQARLFPLSAAVYGDGVVKIAETVDSHGAKTLSVSVPDGARPIRRVAFVRGTGDRSFAVYVVSRATYDGLYAGHGERFGRESPLLPEGEWLQVVNPELYQSFNALFVVALTPVLVAFFARRTRSGKDVGTARKLFYGLVLTSASLMLMVLAGLVSAGGTVKVSGAWLVGFYAVVTCGELMLSPIGLSLVTKLAPGRLVGLAMGGWFMASALGNNLSGFFGGIQSAMSPVAFFSVLCGLAATVAAVVWGMLPRLDAAIRDSSA